MFDWFKKNKKFEVNDFKISCSEVKGKNQKIIIPNSKSHFTFSTSNRYIEGHFTDQGKNGNHRPVFKFGINRMRKYVGKLLKERNDYGIYSIYDKHITKLRLIDPTGNEFLKVVKYFGQQKALPPPFIIKNSRHVQDLFNRKKKVALIFNSFGLCTGHIIINYQTRKAAVISQDFIHFATDRAINFKKFRKQVTEEGIPIDLKFEKWWRLWLSIVIFLSKIHSKLGLKLS